MRTLPEIDPEVRGLLEEIVADPRSCLRLVPRKPLKSWFDSDETVRASDVSGTKAERHLIEAHREALAELLREAARIAYWKAPVWAHRPLTKNGELRDLKQAEPAWRVRAGLRLEAHARGGQVDLLRSCLEGIQPERGLALARASLGLTPSNLTRIDVALTIPWSLPYSALSLLGRLSRRVTSELKPYVLRCMGARLCSVDRLGAARHAYQVASVLDPKSPLGHISAFNLSCYMGDAETAVAESRSLEATAGGDVRVSEAESLLVQWARTRKEPDRMMARDVVARIRERVPLLGRRLCQAIET